MENQHDLRWISLLSIGTILLLFSFSCKKKDLKDEETNVLQILAFYPNSGNAGSLVRIEGTGFDSNLDKNTVKFGGVEGDVLSVDNGMLLVRAPIKGKSGDLEVSNGVNSKIIGKYHYQLLSISRIDPANGPSGAHIRVYGTGFGSLNNPAEVKINRTEALVSSASDTLLVVEVPQNVGSGKVEVFVDGLSSIGQDFKYQNITSIKPMTGGAGTLVRVTGVGFEETLEDNIVDFNGEKAKVLYASPDSLVVEAPDGVETGPIALTINGQRIVGQVFSQVPFPEIFEVSPLSGPAGVEMVISGNYFSDVLDENQVFINEVKLEVKSVSRTSIKLVIPGGTGTGDVVVVVNDQKTKGPKFKDQELGIRNISPDNGLEGTEVRIEGTGFDAIPSNNRVSFGGIAARVIVANENELTVTVPANVRTGDIEVVVGSSQARSPREFRRAGVLTLADGVESTSIAVDRAGNIYALVLRKNQVYRISSEGQKTLFAGSVNGTSGLQDGKGRNALFHFGSTSAIVIDIQGNLYVSEPINQTLRKISSNGAVTTIARNLGPIGKMVMGSDNRITALIGHSGLNLITTKGEVSNIQTAFGVYMDKNTVQFAVDDQGGIYYAANMEYPTIYYNSTRDREVSNWAGSGEYGEYRDGIGSNADFYDFKSLLYDGRGNIIVADYHYLRNIKISTREVTTILKTHRGSVDGSLHVAKLDGINALAIGDDGTYYVAERGGTIRKIFFK